jgi:PPOX class probable F420-dependent enzyme
MGGLSFERLAMERYVSLVTFRRNGSGVATPIWLAEVDGKLYAVTNGTSMKMKRLKNNDRVRLAACDARGNVRGEWVEGRACKVEDPVMTAAAQAALQHKYGWQMAVLKFFSRLSGRSKHRAFIEVSVQV